MLYPDNEEIKLRNAKCVVTGGAGFIGSNLVNTLVKLGSNVTILDNLSTGNLDNLKAMDSKYINFIEGDIRDQNLLNQVFDKARYVFHLAALPSVHYSIKDPINSTEINLIGTLKALEASRINNVKKFIFASSCAVYGNAAKNPVVESIEPNPLTPYAIHKLVSEKYCSVYNQLYDLSTVSLRFFNVFGPNQSYAQGNDYSAVFPNFMTSCLKNKNLKIYGDGSQTRDFIFVQDVVSALINSAVIHDVEDCVINIASGYGLSILDLSNTIVDLFNREIGIDHEEVREGDILHSFADISLSKKLLDLRFNSNLEDNLKITYAYFKRKMQTSQLK